MFFRSLVVASIVSLAAGHCVREYTVKEGDYCDKISASQGVSTYQLAVINNYGPINDDCTNLTPNQKICLGYEGADCTTVYTVVKGDTCDAIATAHNVNTTLLYENNPQIDTECSNIYVGEVLCVASTVIVPPPAGKPLTVPSTAVLAPPTTTPTPSNPTPNTTPSTTPSTTPDYGGDDDDEDLPYCDEL